MRCLTLADAMQEKGWDCRFAASDETFETLPLLGKSKYAKLPLSALGQNKANLLIVDHYGLDAKFETPCRAWATSILVIDDLANRPHDCDILLDQTYGRHASDYKGLIPQDTRILAGAHYALLRPQFAANREASLKRRSGNVERVLVSLGSTNIHNVTSKVLEALALYKDKALDIDVVLGSQALTFAEVQSKVKHLSNAGLHTARLLTNVTDMAALMARADLAIGAGGTTSWERCALGLPALVIEIADNQTFISHELDKTGAIVFAGKIADISAEDIKTELDKIIQSSSRIMSMVEAASQICDGIGVARVLKEIEDGF